MLLPIVPGNRGKGELAVILDTVVRPTASVCGISQTVGAVGLGSLANL
jgi:hypothetical protein